MSFEVTTYGGRKRRLPAPDFSDKRLQALEHDDNQAWQVLEGCFADCEASAIEYLDALSASSSHPGPGAGSEDPAKEPPSEVSGAGSEDTDKEPPSEV